MKKLFTLVGLVCLFVGSADAQNQTVTSTKPVKMVEKEGLKQAKPEQHKVDDAKVQQRAVSVKRIDSTNAQGAVLTEEQMKAKAAEKAANTTRKVKNASDK